MTPTEYQARWRAKKERTEKQAEGIAHRQAVILGQARATEREMARLGSLERRYQLILIDPPWPWVGWSEGGMGRAVENSYPTMSYDQLWDLQIPADQNGCVIFIWTTSTYLHWAVSLLNRWGFAWGGCVVWDKEVATKGKRFRLRAEFIVYGSFLPEKDRNRAIDDPKRSQNSKGLPLPPPETVLDNIFSIRRDTRRGSNSRKPRWFADQLAAQYADATKFAMFCRDDVGPEWDPWGNESREAMRHLAEASMVAAT